MLHGLRSRSQQGNRNSTDKALHDDECNIRLGLLEATWAVSVDKRSDCERNAEGARKKNGEVRSKTPKHVTTLRPSCLQELISALVLG
jgi:hypothetical protein